MTGKDNAKVVSYSDHEVIEPATNLKRFARRVASDAAIDYEAIERAEKALATLAEEFDEWMAAEIERLQEARLAVEASLSDLGARSELFRAAHDIKGEAPTFGYPLAAGIAESLCRLLEYMPSERTPIDLVGQHVDAIRAMVREQVKDPLDSVGGALSNRLREATEETLANEHRDSPEKLAVLGLPTLAPGDDPF